MYRVGRHTGSFLRRDNRNVPGTAHRPFPTVLLVGNTILPHGLYSKRCLVVLRAANQNLLIAGGNHTLIPSINHRRYIAWFHSSGQVIFATQRAADCRHWPQGHSLDICICNNQRKNACHSDRSVSGVEESTQVAKITCSR